MPKKRVKKGGALKADQLQQVLENTYKETNDAPDGYVIDNDLSDDRVKVYKDVNSDQVIAAYRGSKGWRDWLDNARYAYDGDITKSGTYQDAKKRQQKVIDKYGAKNIISVGHSRAGKYVEELNKEQPVKEVITYNKAVHPNTIFQSNPDNQTDVRTSTDLVSALSPLQFNQNKTITIPSGYDLLKAHKPSMLSYLGNKLIGKGYKQMRVADMRRFVKAYKKEKYGERMTGGARLGKKELVDMIKPIMEDDDLDEMVGGSVWTDFVKEFSARHNLKYACSLSKYKEPLKKAYKLKKEGKDWYEPFKTTGEMGVGTYKPPYQPAAEPDDLPYQPPEPETKPEPEPSPMQEMEYKPKMTREMRFQMEKALRESTKHLPPLRSKREDALIAQQVPALKGILKGLKEKTTGLKRQAMIDLILQREGIVKGAVFDDYNDYKQLEEQYKIRRDSSFLLDGLTLTNVRVLLSKLRDNLKEAKQADDARKIGHAKTDIARYTEELKKLERLSKMDQYLIKKYNELKGSGMEGGNRWTDFVKEYATRDNTTYGCALSDAGTKNAYKLFKDGKPWWFPKAKEIETQTEDFVEPEPEKAPVNIEPVVNRIEEKIKKMEEIGRKKGAVTYNATTLVTDIAFINLMKKYGGRCIVAQVMGGGIDIGIDVNNNPKLSDIRLQFVIDRLATQLKECIDRGVKLICIPLSLRFGTKSAGHANMLVYRPFQRLVERFEPHGKQFGNSEKDNTSFNKQLKHLWEEELTGAIGPVRFRDPDDICPNPKGFQTLEGEIASLKSEGGGFCSMWSFFLAEMTFINPDKSTPEILKEVFEITKSDPAYLRSLIRGYVVGIEEEMDLLLKTMNKGSFKFGVGQDSAYDKITTDKAGFEKFILDNVFSTKTEINTAPGYDPLPPELPKTVSDRDKLVKYYKDRLKGLSKDEIKAIFQLYGLKMNTGTKEDVIGLLVNWLDEGAFADIGSTGIRDLEIILDELLYTRKGAFAQGLSKTGYFKKKLAEKDQLE